MKKRKSIFYLLFCLFIVLFAGVHCDYYSAYDTEEIIDAKSTPAPDKDGLPIPTSFDLIPIIEVTASNVYPNPVGTGSALKQNFDITFNYASSVKVTHRMIHVFGQTSATTTRTIYSNGHYEWVIWNVPGKKPFLDFTGIYFTYTILESGSTKVTTPARLFVVQYLC
ncbi:MAG: hypothetical protein JXB88_14385 [Spirochaetales bacterium]|nr:hypothetical protein [Spirochaetales bacterium]